MQWEIENAVEKQLLEYVFFTNKGMYMYMYVYTTLYIYTEQCTLISNVVYTT